MIRFDLEHLSKLNEDLSRCSTQPRTGVDILWVYQIITLAVISKRDDWLVVTYWSCFFDMLEIRRIENLNREFKSSIYIAVYYTIYFRYLNIL